MTQNCLKAVRSDTATPSGREENYDHSNFCIAKVSTKIFN